MDSLKELFMLDPEVVFLNHGSFGACPIPVFEVYQHWQRKLEAQPVRFIATELSERLADIRSVLAEYIHAQAEDVVLIPNATFGVNVIARSLALASGDVVLATDHEYGACNNAWEFVCRKNGADYKQQPIPLPAASPGEITDTIWSGVTKETKIIFMSHITSPTALRLPVEEICTRARESGILTLIDGAHAPGQIPINMEIIGADFYIGNCHKWLMAPKGSAFLYARPDKQPLVNPLIVSWGSGENKIFSTGSEFLDHLQWWGTKDPSAYLTVPTAIKFQSDHKWINVGEGCHELAEQAMDRICQLVKRDSLYMDNKSFNQMAISPLPRISNLTQLKLDLLNDYSVEIPFVEWNNQQFIRVSIQGYNSQSDVDQLIKALAELLPIHSNI